jgi:hypothetical protein
MSVSTVNEGARVIAEAPLPSEPRLANGFFVPPTPSLT